MEYKIVWVRHGVRETKSSVKELEKIVNNEIENGWIPQGGVAPGGYDNEYLLQAMVRK